MYLSLICVRSPSQIDSRRQLLHSNKSSLVVHEIVTASLLLYYIRTPFADSFSFSVSTVLQISPFDMLPCTHTAQSSISILQSTRSLQNQNAIVVSDNVSDLSPTSPFGPDRCVNLLPPAPYSRKSCRGAFPNGNVRHRTDCS